MEKKVMVISIIDDIENNFENNFGRKQFWKRTGLEEEITISSEDKDPEHLQEVLTLIIKFFGKENVVTIAQTKWNS